MNVTVKLSLQIKEKKKINIDSWRWYKLHLILDWASAIFTFNCLLGQSMEQSLICCWIDPVQQLQFKPHDFPSCSQSSSACEKVLYHWVSPLQVQLQVFPLHFVSVLTMQTIILLKLKKRFGCSNVNSFPGCLWDDCVSLFSGFVHLLLFVDAEKKEKDGRMREIGFRAVIWFGSHAWPVHSQ